ncbi:ESPR-type extended signal peptide-containing protein [Megasphaera stantonii]|uniref:ESPR-type extended signal peptide-containing protein n=1 Tax=Megasphaera stantonii TaxID=2144175 RepID=UPI001D8E6A33|nr:ESPR-type extended signal peptide-containing protein [Megasphaera stantonii]HJE83926.1 YadA-like family protein [Megasphaera stantonii]
MNRIYKVIWSKVKHQYVVVSELAHSCTKSAGSRVGRSAAAVLAALVLTTGLCAAPVQAEDLTDPYALLNAQVEETNSTSSDTLVTLVQSPLVKSVAPLANEDEGQPGEGGDTSGTTPTEPTDPATEPTEQHTIVNEDGFYAYNGEKRNTYNSLNKDGLWVGGTDDDTGFHVDNDGNVETTGTVEVKNGTNTVTISKGTVTGLTNTTWTPENPGSIVGNRAATEAQLQAVSKVAAAHTAVTVNGGIPAGADETYTTGNLQLTQTQDPDTGKVTYDVKLNDKITLGSQDGSTSSVVVDGVNGSIILNAVSGDVDSQVEINAAKGTITGLKGAVSDASWDTFMDGTIAGDRVATESDLRTVAQHSVRYDVDENGATTNKVTLGNGTDKVTLTNVADGTTTYDAVNYGQLSKTNENVDKLTTTVNEHSTSISTNKTNIENLTETVNAGWTAQVNGTDAKTVTPKNNTLNFISGDNVTVSNENGSIKVSADLSNLSVDETNAVLYDGTNKKTVTFGGTEADPVQLKNVADGHDANDAVNYGQLSATNTKVDQNTTNITNLTSKVDTGWQAKVGGQTISVKPESNELTFAGDSNVSVTAFDHTIQVGLANSVTIGSGNTSVTIDGTKGNITGLTNTKWDTDTIDSVTNDTDRTGAAAYAATQGQLYDVYNAAVENAKGTQYTAGDGIAIGTGDTPSISVNYGAGLELGEAAGEGTKPLQVNANESNGIEVTDDGVGVKLAASGSNLDFDGNGGLTLADTLTGLTSVTAVSGSFTSKLTVGSNDSVITIENGTISGLADITESSGGDVAVNKTYVDNLFDDLVDNIPTVEGTEYTQGDGVSIAKGAGEDDPSTISVNAGKGLTFGEATAEGGTKPLQVNILENGNLAFDDATGALKLANAISVDSVSAGNIKINVDNSGIITGLKNGKVEDGSTDAVNGSQLYDVQQSIKTYTDGDGITIDAADGNKISVNAGNGITVADDLVTVNTGKGLTFDATDENSLIVATGAGLGFDASNQVKVNVGNGLTIDTTDGANDVIINIYDPDHTGNLVADRDGLHLSSDLQGLTSVSSNSVIVGRDLTTNPTAPELGVTITGQKITGLDINSITDDEDAVNKKYVDKFFDSAKEGLAVQYDQADKKTVTLGGIGGTEITGLAEATWEAGSDSAASVGLVYKKAGEVQWASANYLNNDMDLTEATKALDDAIGTNRYTGENVLDKNTDGKTYASITDTIQRIDNVIGPMQFKATNFLKNQTTLSSGIDKLDSSLSDALGAIGVQTTRVENEDGTVDNVVSTKIDWNNFNYIISGTIVDGMRVLDGHISDLNTRVTTLEGFHQDELSSNSALRTLSSMDMKAAAALSSLSADDLAAIATLSENGTRLPPQGTDDPDTGGDVDDSSTGGDTGNSNPYKGLTTTADKITTDRDFGVTGNLDVTGNTTLGGTLTVTGESTFNNKATFNKDVAINGTLNMNGNKITGVKDGDISADSTDAINGSQLYDTNQRVSANEQNIGILGSAVNKLGDRIERVGAGAAALAALHPLDFDPDNKLDFAAGFGNYRGASAVAVGAFYRPSENVMFSVGGAFGGGEDMVNAGVSFKVGAGSGSATTSRTAMAKSLKSMQEVVASQDAQLAQQREQIDKLTAMVELLMEQNGQAQPKDGDAQAAQPQQ